MTSIPDISPDLEAAAKRVGELSEQVTAQAKANGARVAGGLREGACRTLLESRGGGSEETAVDWASTLATAHRNSFRETTQVFFQT